MGENATPVESGLSRRDLLKRAATVGAAAWAVPIVSTFNTPAFAQAVVSPSTCEKFECGDVGVICGEGAGGFDCLCTEDVEGNPFCANDGICTSLPDCVSSDTCPDGWRCVADTCCETTKCIPPCGVSASENPGTGTGRGGGATAFSR